MKFILLSPQPAPKQETAHYRPKTLGEMKVAFLNANNPKNWMEDEIYPDVVLAPPRKPRVFKTPKQVKRAMAKQQELLAKRAKQRFFDGLHTTPVPTNLREIQRLESRDRQDAEWNLMMSKLPVAELTRLRDEMNFPEHLLVCRLKRLTPQQEMDIWKQMSPDEQIRYAMPLPEGELRKHVFGTRSHFSFRTVLDDISGYSGLTLEESRELIQSRTAATALMFSQSPLSSDEYFAQRIKLLYVQNYFQEEKMGRLDKSDYVFAMRSRSE